MYRSYGLFLLLTAVVALTCSALSGCGSQTARPSNFEQSTGSCDQTAASQTLAGTLAEIDSAQTPLGVDTAVYDQLKVELKRVLQARETSQIAYHPPTSQRNAITDLNLVNTSGDNYDLVWSYCNVGDYNQDKLVSIHDITPIAVYWHAQAGDANWAAAQIADGNDNDMVELADITPIGQYYYSCCEAYTIQRSTTDSGPWSVINTVMFENNFGAPRKQFKYSFEESADSYYRVVPVYEGAEGEPSNVVYTTSFAVAVAPEIGDGTPENPYQIEAGETIYFRIVTTGGEVVTTDPNTAYELYPAGAGEAGNGEMTINGDYEGPASLKVSFNGVSYAWIYFEIPILYFYGDDELLAIPSKTTAAYGETVGVTVWTSNAASPFQYMSGVGVTWESGNTLLPFSFNPGAPGGDVFGIDGIWLDVEPESLVIVPSWAILPANVGNGRERYDFTIAPVGGHDISSATGPLFYFELQVYTDLTLGFQLFEEIDRTFYTDATTANYYWSDIDNDHTNVPNSITVVQ